jgi:hypothetical protein
MRMRRAIALFMIGLVLLVGVISISIDYINDPSTVCFFNKRPPLEKSAKIYTHDDAVRYTGLIDFENSCSFDDFLGNHENKERFVSINSPGGAKKGAVWMVKILEKYKKTVLIEDNAVCGSACVFVFVENHGAVALPGALFFFHKGSSDDPKDMKLLEAMRDWAREISPRLSDFFVSCTVDPTTTDDGIFLYWREITEIAQGVTFNCDFITSLNGVRGRDFDVRAEDVGG